MKQRTAILRSLSEPEQLIYHQLGGRLPLPMQARLARELAEIRRELAPPVRSVLRKANPKERHEGPPVQYPTLRERKPRRKWKPKVRVAA